MFLPIIVLEELILAEILFAVSSSKSCSIAWWFLVKISVQLLIFSKLKSEISMIDSN